jgi:hypothetical protein
MDMPYTTTTKVIFRTANVQVQKENYALGLIKSTDNYQFYTYGLT